MIFQNLSRIPDAIPPSSLLLFINVLSYAFIVVYISYRDRGVIDDNYRDPI